MKILYISASDGKYGAPRALLSMILSLRDNYQVEPVVLTKKHNELNQICEELGIENHTFWYRDIMAGAPYVSGALRLLKHIIKYMLYMIGGVTMHWIGFSGIDFDSVDIVHTNVNRLDIGCYISKKYNIPHIWHIREFGEEDYNVIPYKMNYISYMNKHADKFVAISKAVGRGWTKKGISKEKIEVVYDGIDAQRFIPKKKRSDNLFKIVIVGHVQPNKGQLELVKAICALPQQVQKNITLDIIGNAYGDYRLQIEKVIKEHKLSERVHMIGYCNNIEQRLSQYDVGVTCSKSEGFGLVTVEYMMAGLLAIVSDTGANTEIVQHNYSGFVYRYNDIENLAHMIQTAYQDSLLCKRLADNGKKSALEIFSSSMQGEAVYKVYMQIMEKIDNMV